LIGDFSLCFHDIFPQSCIRFDSLQGLVSGTGYSPTVNVESTRNHRSTSRHSEESVDFIIFADRIQTASELAPSRDDKYYLCKEICQSEDCMSENEKKIKASVFIDVRDRDHRERIRRNNLATSKSKADKMFLDCRGPCTTEFPATPVCSPNSKKVRVEESSANSGNVENRCSTGSQSSCKGTEIEMEEAPSGGEVATEAESQRIESPRECYFTHERLNPDGLEKVERLEQSKVSTGCSEDLQRYIRKVLTNFLLICAHLFIKYFTIVTEPVLHDRGIFRILGQLP
jgi:hypothetical protein